MTEPEFSYPAAELEVEAWCRLVAILRKRKGLGQRDLADLALKEGVQVTVNSLSGWESGRHRPKLETFWLVLRCMGYTAEEIMAEWKVVHDDLVLGRESMTLDELMEQIEKRAQNDPDLRKAIERKLKKMGKGEDYSPKGRTAKGQ